MLMILVVVAAVGYTILRRSIGEPLNARDLLGPPVVLVAVGGYELAKLPGVTAVDIAWLVATSLVGLAFGVWRGSTVRLMTKDGALWQRYPARTYVVWVVSLVVNGGLGFLATHAGMHAEARPMTLSIGIGLLGEAAAVGLRALSTGVPFARESRVGQCVQHRLDVDFLPRVCRRARRRGACSPGRSTRPRRTT